MKKLIYIALLLGLINPTDSFASDMIKPDSVRAIFARMRAANVEKTEDVTTEEVAKEESKEEITEEVKESAEETKEAVEEVKEPAEEAKEAVEEEVNESVEDSEKANEETAQVTGAYEANKEMRTARINHKWSIQALGIDEKLTGHVKIVEDEDNPASGEIIDLENDTTVGKERVPGLRLSYEKGGRTSFVFTWTKSEHDGRLAAAREFKGKRYEADANFEINNSIYDFAWIHRFNHTFKADGREKSYFAGVLGVRTNKLEALISNPVVEGEIYDADSDYSKTIPLPYIGVEYGTYIGEEFYFKANAHFFKANIKHYDAKNVDFDACVSYFLSRNDGNQDIFLDVGYRYINYDVEGEGNDVELKYKGPYVGLQFVF